MNYLNTLIVTPHQHNIFQCCQNTCPTSPLSSFSILQELHQHNTTHHPPSPTPATITSSNTTTINNNSSQTPPSPIEIVTAVIFSLSRPGAINNWSSGINFINELLQLQHTPPDFSNTWCKHLRHQKRNRSNFQLLLLQAAILRSLSTIYATNTNNIDTTSPSPFWWLLIHFEMLLAPTTTAQNNNSIQPTISDRIIALQSGNIQELYQTAMSCNRLSTNTNPTRRSHIKTAQKAVDSDQMKIAVN